MAAKKKELNSEALAVCEALKIALSMDKDATCVTDKGMLMTVTAVGTVYIPFQIELNSAFKAKELFDALHNCDKPYTVSEDVTRSSIKVSWGRKKATLETMPKISVYAPPIDPIQNDQISENFKNDLNEFVSDLISRANDVTSKVVAFEGYEAFWTNRNIAAKFMSGTWIPPVFAFVDDLKVITSLDGNIVGIGGTPSSITFHFDTSTAVKIALGDASSLNYPTKAIKALFSPDILDARYQITDDFMDALNYVKNFSKDYIYVSPAHVGTDDDPTSGTTVEQSDVPLSLLFFADTIKLGAFKKAKEIIKPINNNAIGFFTSKPNCLYAFVRVVDQRKRDE